MESIEAYMKRAVDETASDLFVVAGQTVSMKKEGEIVPIDSERLMPDASEKLVRELYGMVEGKTVMGEGGETKRYYVVSHGAGSFVLYEGDVAALARSAEASLTPLAAWLRQRREGA